MLVPTTTFALNSRVNKIVMVTKPKIFDTIPKWATLGAIFDLNVHRKIDWWQAHISKMLPYDMIRHPLVQTSANLEFESWLVT